MRLGQARGPSAAATCLTFKIPPAASLYAGIPQILFFWIYEIQSPFALFWNFAGHVRTTENGKCLLTSLLALKEVYALLKVTIHLNRDIPDSQWYSLKFYPNTIVKNIIALLILSISFIVSVSLNPHVTFK